MPGRPFSDDYLQSERVAAPIELDVAEYQTHALHGGGRIWQQTNCYVDLWIELLSALGRDPLPSLGCALSADFDGDQWDFLKIAAEDLRVLYGIDVDEINIWRPVLDHIRANLARGVLSTVEVDAFWLPDTAGVSYRSEHTKTTIVPNRIDVTTGELDYFHNSGYYTLGGEDFVGVFEFGGEGAFRLPPYVERIRIDAERQHVPATEDDRDLEALRAHFDRRPARNPVARLADQVRADLGWLGAADLGAFHLWSFGLLRQCGATAELAADVVGYLARRGVAGLAGAREHFLEVAQGAKAVQFRVARVVSGRTVNVDGQLESMAEQWAAAVSILAAAEWPATR